MVLIVIEPPTDRLGRFLRKTKTNVNKNLRSTRRKFTTNLKSLLRTRPVLIPAVVDPNKNTNPDDRAYASLQYDSRLLCFPQAFSYLENVERLIKKGLPNYSQLNLAEHFCYEFTRTKISVAKSSAVIRSPFRSNFQAIPSSADSVGNVIDGFVFINSGEPAIIPSIDNEDHDFTWFAVITLRRSYYESNFHAELSLSLEPPFESNCHVGVELQVLDSYGETFLSRKCHKGFKPVSDTTTVARFFLPNIFDLRTLNDPRNNLIIHNSECHFRISMTCFTGFENDAKLLGTAILASIAHPPTSILRSLPLETMNDDIVLVRAMEGNVKIRAHILSRSQALLHQIFGGAIDLRNFSLNSIINLLQFTRSGKLKQLKELVSCQELQETLELAHQFQEPALKRLCMAEMTHLLNPANAAQTLVLAFVFDAEEDIRLQIKAYFIRHLNLIRTTSKTRSYLKRYPEAFVDILFGPVHYTSVSDETDASRNGYLTALPYHQFLQKRFSSLVEKLKE